MITKNSTSKVWILRVLAVVLLFLGYKIAPLRYEAFDSLENLILTFISIGMTIGAIVCWVFTKDIDRK
jgi:hypothetical protein